jgi:hypothetical protein
MIAVGLQWLTQPNAQTSTQHGTVLVFCNDLVLEGWYWESHLLCGVISAGTEFMVRVLHMRSGIENTHLLLA